MPQNLTPNRKASIEAPQGEVGDETGSSPRANRPVKADSDEILTRRCPHGHEPRLISVLGLGDRERTHDQGDRKKGCVPLKRRDS
jgi:hypothetical protein